jgi:hypothetical protein
MIRGILRGYQLIITQLCDAHCSNESSSILNDNADSAQGCGAIISEELSANVTEFNFACGLPASSCKVSVAARNTAALSQPAEISVETRGSPPARPPRIVRVRQTITGTVMVEFDYPCPHSG